MEAELSKKDRDVFEKEMKKIQVQEGLQKIQEGLKNPEGKKLILDEKKQKQK